MLKKEFFVLFAVLAVLSLSFAGYAVAQPGQEKASEPAKANLTNWKSLLSKEIAAANFDSAVYVLNVANNDKFEHNVNKRFSSASIIKLFILNELFAQDKRGEVRLGNAITFDHAKAVDGGMLHKFSSGATLRMEDLALFMLAVSDNTATNLLIDYLGMDKINTSIKALGTRETILGRKMLDSAARLAGRDNFTCAADVGIVLNSFLKNDPRILDMLSLQKNNYKLSAKLGFDDFDDLEPIFAHKTGELGGIEHDAGIFFYATPQPVIVVVLTAGLPDVDTGRNFIANIGRIVYQTFNRE